MMRYFNNYTFIGDPNTNIDLQWESPDVYGGVKGAAVRRLTGLGINPEAIM